MEECKHPTTRFIQGLPEDKLPGWWLCTVCGVTFTSDPNNTSSVRYLFGPSNKQTKILPPQSTGGDH